MTVHSDSTQTLRRVFQQSFSVHDVAEPLASFDAATPCRDIRRMMEKRRYEIAGVRTDGIITGYIELADLDRDSNRCGDRAKPFEPERLIDDTASLVELVLQLRDHRRLFVRVFGNVGGGVSRSDLEKPAVRMWLFGMITLIEMRFARMIERHCPEAEWRELLSVKRIEKAESLRAERLRRNQSPTLLDCLQFADKAQIVARKPDLRSRTRMQSRRRIEDVARRLEKLRNHLAHVQEISVSNWDTIVALAENFDAVLLGPSDPT